MTFIDEEAFGTLQIVLASKRLLAAGCSLIKSVFSRVCSQECALKSVFVCSTDAPAVRGQACVATSSWW
jgi:hypothetical protein